jgi:KipI family sensor histidine kinase inhibitor
MNTPKSQISDVEILPLALDGLLLRFSKVSSPAVTDQILGFAEMVRAAAIAGVTEVATALTSVLVKFDPDQIARDDLGKALRPMLADQPAGAFHPQRRWTLPVAFGGNAGPQLAEACAMAGVTEAQALKDLTETELRVLAIGFAPGQPYLGQLPEAWGIPRQTQLTPKVPAGAIVVALRQLVLFGNDSTTGWRQVGLCAFRPSKIDRAAPFALHTGDAIRLVAASEAEVKALGANADGLGGARCEVLT